MEIVFFKKHQKSDFFFETLKTYQSIHLLELLEDLKTLYPDDINIKTAIRLVTTLKKANPKMLIKGWKISVNDEYRKQIEEGDFDFFLNKAYDRDIGGDLKQSSSQILEAINLIKVKFRDMFPIELSGIPFDAKAEQQEYYTATARFKYTMFDVIDVDGKKV